jgi:hypothetical protein
LALSLVLLWACCRGWNVLLQCVHHVLLLLPLLLQL